MDLEEFARQIETARWRVAGLERRRGSEPRHPDVLYGVFDELNSAFEELRAAEEELRQQNDTLATTRERVEDEHRRYQELFEFAPDAYLVTTANGTIREANRAAGALLGIAPSALIGTPLALFVSDYTRRAFRHDMRRLQHAESPQHWEIRMQPQGGGAFDAAITVARAQHWSGLPAALRWMIRDVTAHKQAEEQLLALNAQLEQRVRERTGQLEAALAAQAEALAQEQVARAAAETAVRDREAFMAIAAHELKTPLAAINGYADTLQRRIVRGDTLKSRDLRGLRTICEQCTRLSSMIDMLLDASGMVAAQVQLDRAPLDLCALARRVAESLQASLRQHAIELRCSDKPVVVDGDGARLEEVVQNLLQNAIKYSPAGGAVTLVVEQVEDCARLSVSDQGIGIPEAARDQVFQRFYRAENAAAEQISGMGIGLYLVKQLVALHGGWIEVASEVGAGSTFTVWLPLAGASSQNHCDHPKPNMDTRH